MLPAANNPMTTYPAVAVDLTNCDREPIHDIAAIQPAGFLIAVTADWFVAQVSANAPQWFSRPVDKLLGTSLTTLLTPDALHTLRNRLAVLNGEDAVERAFAVPLFGDTRLFDVAVHLSGGKIIIEGEPSERAGGRDQCSQPCADADRTPAKEAGNSAPIQRSGAADADADGV